MTFDDLDHSTQDGQPVQLFEFVTGASVARFASCAEDVGTAPLIYSASAVKVGTMRAGENIFKDSIKITFPRSDLFAKYYIWNSPDTATTVTVKRWHRGLSTSAAIVEWKGRIVSVTTGETTIALECESIYTSLKRIGLAMQFEISCIHPLYAGGCGASKPSMRHDTTIVSAGAETVEVASLSAFSNGWFSGGLIEYAGDARFILNHSGNILRLASPMTSLSAGDNVALYPGCDKTTTTCLSKFNNIDNYLGFPWMPNRNPFDGTPIA